MRNTSTNLVQEGNACLGNFVNLYRRQTNQRPIYITVLDINFYMSATSKWLPMMLTNTVMTYIKKSIKNTNINL